MPEMLLPLSVTPLSVTPLTVGAWVSMAWLLKLLKSWSVKALPASSLSKPPTKDSATVAFVLVDGVTTTVSLLSGMSVTDFTVPLVAVKLFVDQVPLMASLKLTSKLMSALVTDAVWSVTAFTTGATVSTRRVLLSANANVPWEPALPAASVQSPKLNRTLPLLILALGVKSRL